MNIFQIIFLIFLILKLTETINWPWWEIGIPAYIVITLGLLIAICEYLNPKSP